MRSVLARTCSRTVPWFDVDFFAFPMIVSIVLLHMSVADMYNVHRICTVVFVSTSTVHE